MDEFHGPAITYVLHAEEGYWLCTDAAGNQWREPYTPVEVGPV